MTSMNLARTTTNELLYVAFNQDSGCFAAGTDKGFRIYHIEPFKETFKRDFSSGGIGIVEMLFRCNILALVGGGPMPRFAPHKVMIWDDHQNRCIGELAFRHDVKAVKLRRDRVVVALASKVYVYNFADLSLLDHIESCDNPRGLLALCSAPHNNVLACPGLSKGHVRLELYDQRKTTLIAAHEAALACIALNNTGSRVATASEKGTLIRVYDTATGELLQELRRGADRADIYSIAFNQSSSMLACSSDKGTVHIFRLKETVYDTTPVHSAGLRGDALAAASAAGVSAAGVGSGAPSPASARGSSGVSSGTAGSASAGLLPPTAGPAIPGSGGDLGGTGSGSNSSSGLGKPGALADGRGASDDSHTASGAAGLAAAPAGSGEAPASATSHGSAGSLAGPAQASGASGGGTAANPKSSFAFMRGLLPKYFSSEWSFAQFRVPETRALVAFGQEPHTIVVVGADGSFFKANYEKGGEAVRVAYSHFVAGSQYGLE